MFTLSQIVPFGRSFDEYCRMFSLSDIDLQRNILGCADGPASFNAEATGRGGRVVSCDPLYAFDSSDIAQRIENMSYVSSARITNDYCCRCRETWPLIPEQEVRYLVG